MNIYSLKLPVDETTSLLDKEHNWYIMYAFSTQSDSHSQNKHQQTEH